MRQNCSVAAAVAVATDTLRAAAFAVDAEDGTSEDSWVTAGSSYWKSEIHSALQWQLSSAEPPQSVPRSELKMACALEFRRHIKQT